MSDTIRGVRVPLEFWSWSEIPDSNKRVKGGEREVCTRTFAGEPAWVPHMAVDRDETGGKP